MSLKSWKLAVRLVKDNYTVEQCVNREKIQEARLQESAWPLIERAVITAGNAYSSPPKWRGLFTRNNLPDMNNRGAVCFISLPIRNKLLFVSFGPAQIYLNPEAFERDFGLRVTLNSVEEKNLVSVDARTPEDQSIQRRVQASRESDVTAFGIDVSRDLLRGVAGRPSDSSFASLVAGSDTLIIHTKVDETTLVRKCEEILEKYLDESYKTKFPWIDNVRPIKDKPLIESLDQELVDEINRLISSPSGNVTNDSAIYLAIPEIIDHQYSANYGFAGLGRVSAEQDFPLPELNDYIRILGGSQITLDDLKEKHKIAQRADGSGDFIDKWSVYKCLVYEINKNDSTFILSEGDWYQVDNNYAQSIETFFTTLLSTTDVSNLGFLSPATTNDNEITYIGRLKSSLPGNVVCLHGEDEIKAGDWNSPIEPCDLYTGNKDFIHLKNETSSSTLSHLFLQGLVSAQVYKRSSDFRAQLKSKVSGLNTTIGNMLTASDPTTSDYRVVYAILRRPYLDGNFNLPFFSKVSLKTTIEQLRDLNYKTGLIWIRKQ